MNLAGLALFLLLVAAILVLLAAARSRAKTSLSAKLCKEFRLDPSAFTLLGTDLADGKQEVWLRGDGLVGKPDAVFRHNPTNFVLVVEAKSRYYRGTTKPYELYQLTLYLGLARRRYRTKVKGRIRYGCGKTVSIPFDYALYKQLLAEASNCRAAMRDLS